MVYVKATPTASIFPIASFLIYNRRAKKIQSFGRIIMLLKSIYAPRILLRKNSSDLIKPMLYSINRLPAVKVNISTKPSRFLSRPSVWTKICCGSLETNSAIRFGSGLFCPYQFFINSKSSLQRMPHSKMPFYRFFSLL